MEDPWLNAWGDPQKSSPNASTKPSPGPTWTPSSSFITDDQADIAVPSWDGEAGAIWNDSPDLQKDLWSRENRTSQLWTVPTFESIGFAKPPEESSSVNPSNGPSRSSSPPRLEPPDQQAESSPEITKIHDEATIHSPRTLNVDPTLESPKTEEVSHDECEEVAGSGFDGEAELPRISSPDLDGFGTFEGAQDDGSHLDPWMPPQREISQADDVVGWGDAWTESSNAVDEDEAEPLDEWELAKRQKQRQDHYVPPELMNSILNRYDEFARDYWPEKSSEDTTYQHNQAELAGQLDITSIAARLIPSDLTLSPLAPFTSTSASKEMIEALKLTRHHVITRLSPLAIYMNTKGSLSWEASVKSKPDVTEADVVPSGWRIVPNQSIEHQQSVNDTNRKATGGLLSFFGRKPAINAPQPGSPVRSSTPATTSPRSSFASSRPSADVTAVPSTVVKTAPSSSPAKENEAGPSATLTALAEVSGAGKPDANPLSPEAEQPAQAPSAVSRFFSRFSRSNRASSANSRNSIALSSDDLEFLSDIVPSANDEMDELDQLNALSTVVQAPPVPTKLPPPLAPPPRAPPLPKPLSPPPSVDSRPLSPTVQRFSSGTRPNSAAPSIESQLFDLGPGYSSRSPSQNLTPSPITSPGHSRGGSSNLPPPLPPPISPNASSRSHSPAHKPPVMSFPVHPPAPSSSIFDDDEFSEFQTSPDTSTSVINLDSSFSSFTTSAPVKPIQTDNQPTSFDDFDEFISPPPQVPEKPTSIPIQPSSIPPPPRSIPPMPVVKSSSPTKLPSIHNRRLSRQAESDQRAMSLLETAAARGKWPAPPSPLPSAIPPPVNKNTGNNLFDAISATAETAVNTNFLDTESSSPSNTGTISPPPLLAGPPPSTAVINKNTAGASVPGIGPGLGGMRSPPPTAPAMPPPLIPPHPPMKPATPQPPLSLANSTNQNLPSFPGWRAPSLLAADPLPSLAQPSSFGLGNGGNSSTNGSRSGTPSHRNLQQQGVADIFSSLTGPAVSLTTTEPSSHQSGGSNSGKLSAQDLSFFEGL